MKPAPPAEKPAFPTTTHFRTLVMVGAIAVFPLPERVTETDAGVYSKAAASAALGPTVQVPGGRNRKVYAPAASATADFVDTPGAVATSATFAPNWTTPSMSATQVFML